MIVQLTVVGGLTLLGFLRRRRRVRYIEASCHALIMLEEHLAEIVEYGLASPHDPLVRTLTKLLPGALRAIDVLKRFLRPTKAFVEQAHAVGMLELLKVAQRSDGDANPWLKNLAIELYSTIAETLRYDSSLTNRMYRLVSDCVRAWFSVVDFYLMLKQAEVEIEESLRSKQIQPVC